MALCPRDAPTGRVYAAGRGERPRRGRRRGSGRDRESDQPGGSGATGPAVTISGGSAEIGAATAPRKPPTSCWSATIRARSRCRFAEARTRARLCLTRTLSANLFDWAGGTGNPRPSACPRTILPCAPRSSSGPPGKPDPRRGEAVKVDEFVQAKSASPPAKADAICGDRAAISRTRPIPDPRPQSRKVRTMTSRLKFLVPAAACVALGAVAFANVALAEDAPQDPWDAMSGDHMSGDHMAGHMADEEAPHEKAYDERGRAHDGAGDAEIIHLSPRARPPS